MTAPVHGGANPGRTARSLLEDGDETRARDASLRRHAWLRAMERATVESWFRDHPAGPSPGAGRGWAPADALASRPAPQAERAPPPAAGRAVVPAASPFPAPPGDLRCAPTAGTGSADRARSRAPEASLARDPSRDSAAPAWTAAGPALAPREGREPPGAALSAGCAGAPEAIASLAALARAVAGARERERLRVHAEWTDDGVRVWLGADRDPSAPVDLLAGALLPRLHRWAEARGTRLAALVCNGRTIWERGAAAPPRSATRPDPAARSSRRPGDHAPLPPHLSHEEENP